MAADIQAIMRSLRSSVGQLPSTYVKPNYVNVSNPALLSYAELQNKLGSSMVYDRGALQKLYQEATSNAYNKSLEEQKANERAYWQSLANIQGESLDTLKTVDSSAVVDGTNQGMRAANQLSAILGLQQQSLEGTNALVNNRITMAKDNATQLSQDAKDAISNANDYQLQLGTLLRQLYADQQTQQAQELAYNQAINTDSAGYSAAYDTAFANLIESLYGSGYSYGGGSGGDAYAGAGAGTGTSSVPYLTEDQLYQPSSLGMMDAGIRAQTANVNGGISTLSEDEKKRRRATAMSAVLKNSGLITPQSVPTLPSDAAAVVRNEMGIPSIANAPKAHSVGGGRVVNSPFNTNTLAAQAARALSPTRTLLTSPAATGAREVPSDVVQMLLQTTPIPYATQFEDEATKNRNKLKHSTAVAGMDGKHAVHRATLPTTPVNTIKKTLPTVPSTTNKRVVTLPTTPVSVGRTTLPTSNTQQSTAQANSNSAAVRAAQQASTAQSAQRVSQQVAAQKAAQAAANAAAQAAAKQKQQVAAQAAAKAATQAAIKAASAKKTSSTAASLKARGY